MPNQEPASAGVFGNGPVRVGTQGLFRPLWKLSSRLFSQPDWLPLSLRGCFRKGCRKKCAPDNPKGNQYSVPDTYFCCFPSALENIRPWPLVPISLKNSELNNHPQYLSGLPRARLPTTFLKIAVYTAISRKVVGKMCTRQSRKVIWDMFNTLFLTP